MIDTIMVILWAIVYILMLYVQIRFRNERSIVIPFIAAIFNLAWEMNAAMYSGGFWAHMLWLVLDIGIFVLNIDIIWHRAKKPWQFTAVYLTITACSMQLFFISLDMKTEC